MNGIDWYRVLGWVVLPIASWAVVLGVAWLVVRAVRP